MSDLFTDCSHLINLIRRDMNTAQTVGSVVVKSCDLVYDSASDDENN